MEPKSAGKILIALGILLLVAGLYLFLSNKWPGLRRMPGDIFIRRENFTFYFPLGWSILLSVLLTLLLWILRMRQ